MRLPRQRSLFVWIVLLWFPSVTPLAGAEGGTSPYTLAVRVEYGAPGGPQTLIEDLEQELLDQLSTRGCFRKVQLAGPGEPSGTDFLLRMTLNGFFEEVRYEASIGQRARAYDPEVLRQLVAEFSLAARSELLSLPEELLVRAVSVHTKKEVRPRRTRLHEDDAFARQEARLLGLEHIALETSAKVCKGSAKRLEKELEKARVGAHGNPTAR